MNRLENRDTIVLKTFVEYEFVVKLFLANGIEVYPSVRLNTRDEYRGYPHLHWTDEGSGPFLSANKATPGDKRYEWMDMDEFLVKAGIIIDKEHLTLITKRSTHNEGRKIIHTFI